MSHDRVSAVLRLLVVGVAVLMVSSHSLAESRPEVLERIRPVGQVEVEGQAKPAAPVPTTAPAEAPAATAEPVATAEPAPAPAATQQAPAPSAADGAALYAAKGCPACHGADGSTTILPVYPKLAGQSSEYAFNQMNDIKSGARSGGQAMIMKGIIAQVSEEEMRIIADWLSGL